MSVNDTVKLINFTYWAKFDKGKKIIIKSQQYFLKKIF